MKKLLLYLLLPALAVFNSSCNDDDDPPPAPDHAAMISGTYAGWVYIYEAETPGNWESIAQDDPGFEIGWTDKNHVSLKIGELNFSSIMPDPDEVIHIDNLQILNLTVTPNGNKYNISGQNLPVTVASDQYTKGIASVSGTFNPSLKADNLTTIDLTLQYAPTGEIIYSKTLRLKVSSTAEMID